MRYTKQVMIQAIRDTKGFVSLAAKRLGCSRETVRAYVNRYPAVAQALKDERELMTDIAELTLFNQIQAGDGWAVCFYLKTQGRSRGYGQSLELSGAVNTTGVLLVTGPVDAEEWATLAPKVHEAQKRQLQDAIDGDGSS